MNAGTGYQDHEAAAIFPLMDDKRLGELVESIREHGLLHDIVLHEGQVLDGRNRLLACRNAGVNPRFTNFVGDPFAYAWNANGQRRDLSAAQRYGIWTRTSARSTEWQAQQQLAKDAANEKRTGRPKTGSEKSPPTTSGDTSRDRKAERAKESSTAKAKASGTDRGTVEKFDELDAKRHDLAEKVIAGEVTLTAAKRELKKGEVAQKVAALPDGKYRVIYADPPWQYNDSRAGLGGGDGVSGGIDRASTAARDHYPTMSVGELCALDIKSLAPADAVLFCWATFPLLPDQLAVVKAWGFEYKTAFVWDKGRGSFGNYHTCEAEILFVCTRGSCTPDVDKRESQIQHWPRAEHSRKPAGAREMIDRMYPHGPRIELFNRGGAPEGWAAWGAESESAVAA